jgi:hypothetical protein
LPSLDLFMFVVSIQHGPRKVLTCPTSSDPILPCKIDLQRSRTCNKPVRLKKGITLDWCCEHKC